MQTIDSHFIGNFKDGDNICFNLEVINSLYRAYRNQETGDQYFRKPIIIFLLAVIEATLDDFFYKVRHYTIEGVPNVPHEFIIKVRSSNESYRNFKSQIRFIRKNDLFQLGNTNYYSTLDEFRVIRNRLHIQNNFRNTPLNEKFLFTEEKLAKAERLCEFTLKHMSSKYPRPITHRDYVADFILPWNAHFEID